VTATLLAGDLGGTNTRLALYERSATGVRELRKQTFASKGYPSFDAVVAEFLGDAPPPLAAAHFAVAGPVEGAIAHITNLPWVVDGGALGERFAIPSVALLNDLQAAAYGMLYLPPSDFADLGAATAGTSDRTIAVIAPGTGLGEALLYWDGTRYHALPSEGGHADFAAHTDQEIALLRHLQQRHTHVSYERVLSGDGIGNVYDFLRAGGPAEPTWLRDRLAAGDRNPVISAAALAGDDPVCVATLDLFAGVLGAEAANLALRGLAAGGVIIGGGIAPQLVPLLRRGPLLERFWRKGRFEAWVRTLSLRVALNKAAPLIGAAHWPGAGYGAIRRPG
jgi:glucokinase